MGYADVYIPAGGKEDFQAEASFGYRYTTYTGLYPSGTAFFSYASSGWSPTRTITLGETSVTASPNPTPTPSLPEFSVLAILPFFFSVLLVAVYLRHRRTGHE
jgi:hypothetical protein